MTDRQVVMGLLFYPRGGSAQVCRYLRRALTKHGWPVSLVSGSLGVAGEEAHAATFFGDEGLCVMDYSAAVERFRAGLDPFAGQQPMHPSYEDQGDVPDQIFTALSRRQARHLSDAWQSLFQRCGLDRPALFHLHHLTPQFDAATAIAPDSPIVAHLHGTEMKMTEGIHRRRRISRHLGASVAEMPRVARSIDSAARALPADLFDTFQRTDWSHWRYAGFWERQLRSWARSASQVITIAPDQRRTAIDLFGLEEERVVAIPNGVDVEHFAPLALSPDRKLALLRAWLVDDPRGWDESGQPGTIRYTPSDIEGFTDPQTGDLFPIIMYVGRFLGFKRVPMLIRAFQQARPRFAEPAKLLIWGGSPGEWEGEHPHVVARDGGEDGIFFSGWRGHTDLPLGLNVSNVLAAPSVDEPFGQVYLEAMAAGLPVIATNTGGPRGFVNVVDGAPNGWLVPPDDLEALAGALVEAINQPEERAARGANARSHIQQNYSWDSIAGQVEYLYEKVLREHDPVT